MQLQDIPEEDETAEAPIKAGVKVSVSASAYGGCIVVNGGYMVDI